MEKREREREREEKDAEEEEEEKKVTGVQTGVQIDMCVLHRAKNGSLSSGQFRLR